ncbi:hypothetical protein I9W82_004425 [Candida metapsilosis]|uniref:Uncharacterized protein n=1 Tax=Candida metapsilosis TaxID=273372 RepID=A0A8H7ZFW4_9ASCO|nr:hypothetical protein I9W82_004425 [Candida metapsilosis]
MSHPDAPPAYTTSPLESNSNYDQPPPQIPPRALPRVGNEPVYFEDAAPRGWTISINKRKWGDGYTIFVSKDAAEKYKAFKKSSNEHVLDLQRNGIGIPLLKAETPFNPYTPKYLTFSRNVPNDEGSFDSDKAMSVFCQVRKFSFRGYDTFIFDFTPDPKTPKVNFQIFMFVHSTIPIYDYKYKGDVHRWVDESNQIKSDSNSKVKYAFKHSILKQWQPSLVDSWDGYSNGLDEKKHNPYLKSLFAMKLKPDLKLPKQQYYGDNCTAILEETDSDSGNGEVKIDDLYSTDPNINYESVLSVHVDALVLVCVATVLKRQKENDEDKRRNNNNTPNTVRNTSVPQTPSVYNGSNASSF